MYFFQNSSLLGGMVQTKLVYGNDDQGRVYENCKILFNFPRDRGSSAWSWSYSEDAIFLLLFLSTLGHGSDKLSIKQ